MRGDLDRPLGIAGVVEVVEGAVQMVEDAAEVEQLPTAELGTREHEKELSSLGVRRLPLLRREGALEVRDRLLVGMRGKGALAGRTGVAEELLAPEQRLGFCVVMGELCCVRFEIRAVELLERVCDLRV